MSCKYSVSKVGENPDIGLMGIGNTDDKNIWGNWTMCSESGNGVMTWLNTCKTIVFKPDGSGSVSIPSSLKQNFSWTYLKGVLSIRNDNILSSHTFLDTFYFAVIKNRKEGMEFQIQNQKSDATFYLSK